MASYLHRAAAQDAMSVRFRLVGNMNSELTRRRWMLLFAMLVAGLPMPALARDGESGGNSGSGSNNSGSGGGGSDDDGDDDDNGGDDDDNGGGSGGDDKGGRRNRDAEHARNAVRSGQVVPLAKLLEMLRQNYPGKLIDVRLRRGLLRKYYDVKLLTKKNRVERLRFDALTLVRL